MTTPTPPSYAGHRFPAEIISHAVWLYFRFPLSLRMVEEMLAARGIIVSHEAVRQWAHKFGQDFANRIRRRLPGAGDKWHLDEVAIRIAGKKHWVWRAVDQDGIVLDMAPSSCAAEVEAIRVAWAECIDGYAKAATPVTSAQIWKAWVRAARH
jgi:putative transposase